MGNANWRAAVDLERLRGWMDHQGLGAGPLAAIHTLAGGSQNIMLRFERAGRSFVLRRPPQHLRANSNETMRREARVLAALADTAVPHARLIAACEDEAVLGAVFYLMEPVCGFNATVLLPPLHAEDPAIRRQMGFAIVDGLLQLGRVDPTVVGLAGLGRIDGFLERQVGRWLSQLDSYAEHDGWSGAAILPRIAAIAAWLEAHRPAGFISGIMHGDYHLANVMYAQTGPELAAIVDWELATIGDPLIDLGWLLVTWPDAGGTSLAGARIEPWAGFPTADELLDHYRAHSPRDLSAIDWYRVFACYKLGILLEGTFARACAGKAEFALGDALHRSAMSLLEQAHRLVAS